jgi:mRNA-degrading endonuclease RelE of RelBE toxin-antitoxin system
VIGFTASARRWSAGRNDWRVRIGEYRTVYAIDGDTVVVMQVRHRRDVYR